MKLCKFATRFMAACTVRNIHVRLILKPLNSMPMVYVDITVLVTHDRQLTVSMKHGPYQKTRNDSYGQVVVKVLPGFVQLKIHYAVRNGPTDSTEHDRALFS